MTTTGSGSMATETVAGPGLPPGEIGAVSEPTELVFINSVARRRATCRGCRRRRLVEATGLCSACAFYGHVMAYGAVFYLWLRAIQRTAA